MSFEPLDDCCFQSRRFSLMCLIVIGADLPLISVGRKAYQSDLKAYQNGAIYFSVYSF